MHIAVGANVDVTGGGEGGLANAGAGLVGNLGVVVFGGVGGKGGQVTEIVLGFFVSRSVVLIRDIGVLFAVLGGEEGFFGGRGEGEAAFRAKAGGLDVELLTEGFEGLWIF